MRQIQDLSDERQRGWCPHCGVALKEHNRSRDHVPTRGLLSRPYPPNLPVVHICGQCNAGFSVDEAYLIAFLGAVMSGSTNVDAGTYRSAAKLLRDNDELRRRIADSEQTQIRYAPEWKPEPNRVKRVMMKNARGHWLYEVGESVTEDPHTVWAQPLDQLPDAVRSVFEPSSPIDESLCGLRWGVGQCNGCLSASRRGMPIRSLGPNWHCKACGSRYSRKRIATRVSLNLTDGSSEWFSMSIWWQRSFGLMRRHSGTPGFLPAIGPQKSAQRSVFALAAFTANAANHSSSARLRTTNDPPHRSSGYSSTRIPSPTYNHAPTSTRWL